MIEHQQNCHGTPCTCGAKARARARAEHPASGEPIHANITADRLGIALPPLPHMVLVRLHPVGPCAYCGYSLYAQISIQPDGQVIWKLAQKSELHIRQHETEQQHEA